MTGFKGAGDSWSFAEPSAVGNLLTDNRVEPDPERKQQTS